MGAEPQRKKTKRSERVALFHMRQHPGIDGRHARHIGRAKIAGSSLAPLPAENRLVKNDRGPGQEWRDQLIVDPVGMKKTA